MHKYRMLLLLLCIGTRRLLPLLSVSLLLSRRGPAGAGWNSVTSDSPEPHHPPEQTHRHIIHICPPEQTHGHIVYTCPPEQTHRHIIHTHSSEQTHRHIIHTHLPEQTHGHIVYTHPPEQTHRKYGAGYCLSSGHHQKI